MQRQVWQGQNHHHRLGLSLWALGGEVYPRYQPRGRRQAVLPGDPLRQVSLDAPGLLGRHVPAVQLALPWPSVGADSCTLPIWFLGCRHRPMRGIIAWLSVPLVMGALVLGQGQALEALSVCDAYGAVLHLYQTVGLQCAKILRHRLP